MKKVLFIMPDLYYAGAEYQVRNIIACCLKSSNIQVFLALENAPESKSIEFFCKDNPNFLQENIYLMNIKQNDLIKKELKYYSEIIKIKRLYSINEVFLYDKYGILAIPLFKLLRIKVIYSERNSGDVTMSHFLYRLFLKKIKYVTCNSDYAKNKLEHGLHRDIYKINNYVEVPKLNVIRHNSLQDKNRISILLSARVSAIKNQELVFDYLERYSGVKKIKVLVAGNVDEDEYLHKLKNKIKNFDSEVISVEFLGFVADKEKLYNECDLVILPSFSEGTPNVVLESFARKIPVIASNIPQNFFLFANNNFLFAPDSIEEFAKALDYVLSLKEIEMQLELEKNYALIVNEFGIDAGPQRYVALLE